MQGKEIVAGGANGRRIIREAGRPDRVALPTHCADGAVDAEEAAILHRFFEASEMAKGNMAVAVMDGDARGRYARYAAKVAPEDYANFEIHAYRWILREAFGKKAGKLAEVMARLEGERVSFSFEEWGALIVNVDGNADLAMGAAIGTLRALAWMLADAYRDYNEFWRIREEAAKHGRALTESESVQRVRRGQEVARAVAAHRPNLIDESGG